MFASSARPSVDEKGASFDEKRSAGAYGTAAPTATAAELFVPANMPLSASASATSPPPASTSPAPAGVSKKAKPRAHHAHGPPAAAVGGLDDYFREGEAKSQEEDFVPKKREGGVPPPPRAGAGGPPRGGPPRSGTGTPVVKEKETEKEEEGVEA